MSVIAYLVAGFYNMNDDVRRFLDAFEKDKWWAKDIGCFLNSIEALYDKPEELLKILWKCLTRFDDSLTFFDAGLSYISKAQFQELVCVALGLILEGRKKDKTYKNSNAESVIAYASLQFPEILHDYLDIILELEPNKLAYYFEYPWRNLEKDKITHFVDDFSDPATSLEHKKQLFLCLLNTRDIETVQFIFNYAKKCKLILPEYLKYYIGTAPYLARDDKFVSYCPNQLHHIIFSESYLPKNALSRMNNRTHPTWNLVPTDMSTFKLGGILDQDDNNPLFHAITFKEIPNGLDITGLMQLTLACHFCELDIGSPVFYQHDENGMPTRIGEKIPPPESSSFNLGIREAEVMLSPTPPRWHLQDWALSNNRENLFRIGGEPTWIQNADVPECPLCHQKMDFLMQLNSGLPGVYENDVIFGDEGMCYVFWCNETKVSAFLMQSIKK